MGKSWSFPRDVLTAMNSAVERPQDWVEIEITVDSSACVAVHHSPYQGASIFSNNLNGVLGMKLPTSKQCPTWTKGATS